MQKMKLISLVAVSVLGLVVTVNGHRNVKVNNHYEGNGSEPMSTNAIFDSTSDPETVSQPQRPGEVLVYAPNAKKNRVTFELVNGSSRGKAENMSVMGFRKKIDPMYVLGTAKQGTKVKVFQGNQLIGTINLPRIHQNGNTDNYVFNSAGVTVHVRATTATTDNVSFSAMKFDPKVTEVPVYLIDVSNHDQGVAGFRKDWHVKDIVRQ